MGVKKDANKMKGFSLIEILVVMFIIGISLPVLFNLTYTILINQEKTMILSEIKENGDYALSQMETVIRNRAYRIVTANHESELCGIGTSVTIPIGSEAHFLDYEGNYFSYAIAEDDEDAHMIASHSGLPQKYPLTNSRVHVVNGTFLFNCVRTSDYSPPIVNVAFTLSQRLDAQRHEEKNTLSFSSSIKLLNYGVE